MPFHSLLFGSPDLPADLADVVEPEYFHDLNLDQVCAALGAGRDEYRLTPYFRYVLHDVDRVEFRQRVFRDLEDDTIRGIAVRFGDSMREMRERLRLAGKLRHPLQKQRWFLAALGGYCAGAESLAHDLAGASIDSAGLIALRDDVAQYTSSAQFQQMRDHAAKLVDELAGVHYNILIRSNKITVGGYDDEPDYSARIAATFERFRQGAAADHRMKVTTYPDMDHVESGIVELVAQLYAPLFDDLASFCRAHQDFRSDGLVRTDSELQFYLGYLGHLEPLRAAGLCVCYPEVSTASKEFEASETYDLALAAKLVADGATVVVNDVELSGTERILVVSGPNQGGKTTLARTFGQLHHLAALGCPVPGRQSHCFLPDLIYTHFEREEELDTLAGKLEDELRRIHDILDHASTDSVIIMNEIFTSTTLQDAQSLSGTVLDDITELDALCMCVSFIDELSTRNAKTVSMVSTVAPDDPATRTYRLVRRPADGRAYAVAIAEKYGLTYERLTKRIGA